MAQCRIRGGCVEILPIDITELPQEALDKGCPTEPAEMAELIKSVVEERKIVARRAAVIIPAVAFTTIPLCIEAELSKDEALAQLGEAGSAVQLPFPRNQADVELIDITDREDRKRKQLNSYLLMAVQRSSTDKLVRTFQEASLDLQFVDSGLLAPLRLIQQEIESLTSKEQLLHLNLAPGVTTCTTVWRGGPQKLQRLAPVRPFPLFMGQENEDYFPLTPEDLLSLGRDLKRLMKESTSQTKLITLAGTGSGHPGLDELLNEALDIPVKLVKPFEHPKVGSFELPAGFNAQAMGRVVGMALRCLHMEENADQWESQRRMTDQESTSDTKTQKKKSTAEMLRLLWQKLNKPM